ncbi:MAG TPA: carbonic anhydrase [Phycisphaerae bacterium]|nr:carbonic anhydrase [Phycisphaerae bacterium]HNU46745.1 carbonic anhydrase [Phycisphaerae bacterium]
MIAHANPDTALQLLRDGNSRFAAGSAQHPHGDSARRLETLTNGQRPFAAVLACSDSRVPVEVIFDQGIGDLFVVRVAGNVCGSDQLGSLEYAVEHLETPLIVVLGHSDCGAVKAALHEALPHGAVAGIVDKIMPLVVEARGGNPALPAERLVSDVILLNVHHVLATLLREGSPALRTRVSAGTLAVVGAVYDLHTGSVEWLGPHPRQYALLAETRRDHSPRRPS